MCCSTPPTLGWKKSHTMHTQCRRVGRGASLAKGAVVSRRLRALPWDRALAPALPTPPSSSSSSSSSTRCSAHSSLPALPSAWGDRVCIVFNALNQRLRPPAANSNLPSAHAISLPCRVTVCVCSCARTSRLLVAASGLWSCRQLRHWCLHCCVLTVLLRCLQPPPQPQLTNKQASEVVTAKARSAVFNSIEGTPETQFYTIVGSSETLSDRDRGGAAGARRAMAAAEGRAMPNASASSACAIRKAA